MPWSPEVRACRSPDSYITPPKPSSGPKRRLSHRAAYLDAADSLHTCAGSGCSRCGGGVAYHGFSLFMHLQIRADAITVVTYLAIINRGNHTPWRCLLVSMSFSIESLFCFLIVLVLPLFGLGESLHVGLKEERTSLPFAKYESSSFITSSRSRLKL